MPITRKFLDWTQPALPAAVEYLQQEYRQRQTLDLDQVVLVVPGGRAGRRLLELLAEYAETNSLLFFPPQIRTAGSLPELLYEPKRPFANDLTQQLVWVQALQSADRERCRQFIPTLPAEQDLNAWMELGGVLSRQHRELAADGLNFRDVASHGQQIDGFPETERWQFLSDVQQRYLNMLDGLGLWDLQTARLVAIENNECQTDLNLVMIGTSDMNLATRRMLDQVADHVTAIIHAPASFEDRFDQHGCLVPAVWQDATVDLKTEQLQIADGPADQANAVVRTIANLGDRYRVDQIVVGVPNDQLVPQLQRTLLQAGTSSRWVVGRSLPDTAPYKLLSAISAYLSRGRFADFAALVRHPDVYRWLEAQKLQGDWLSQLDEYYNDHLPVRPGNWLGSANRTEPLRQLHAAVDLALEPLSDSNFTTTNGEGKSDSPEGEVRVEPRAVADSARREPRRPQTKSQPLDAWSEPIRQVLLVFYGDSPLDTLDLQHHYTIKSLNHIRNVLLEHNQVPQQVSPPVSATEAILLLLQQLAGTEVPPLPDDQAIELLGWLELPLDEAPALVVTSFNEGYVPKSVNSDLFLPNTLRQKLGLLDNARRYARDAYALSVLVASRNDLSLIAGRHTADNDPLSPSRLAFATDDQSIAQRALAFFRPIDAAPPLLTDTGQTKASQLVVPKPRRLAEPITTVSVTAFRSYLACRYRFYLRHVLRLAPLDDEVEELDAPTFGNVIHEVLRQFGEHKLNTSNDPSKIGQFLKQAARKYIDRTYGKQRPPAVDVQTAQLEERLAAFARWQAHWASQGWQIKYVEATCDDPPAELNVDEERKIILRGRIDRIDYHPDTKQWAVFDYKTSDTAKPPDKMHRKNSEWIDLQLPLYRHLIRGLGIQEPVRLGYIVLPKDVSKVGELWAEWDEETLAVADDVAMQVADAILNEEFWPPEEQPPDMMAEFAAICQDNAYRARWEEE
jgi:ATP-dependent helicase/nuclease subunit B